MRWLWILLGLAAALVLLIGAFGVGLGLGYTLGDEGFGFGGRVALIRVEGAIQSGDGPDNPFLAEDGAYSEEITKLLRQAQRDDSIKAVILRVDSPGGGVTASDEIRNEILRTQREYGKPVVVSMGSLAASGGYYISAPADHIVANPTTLTGSVGVIMIVPAYQQLLDNVGVETYVFKSGDHKDDSSGLRPLKESDVKIFEGLIADSYERFVQIVSEGRGLEIEQVRKLADGRIYTGEQAHQAGLVDSFGDLPEAVAKAGELAGIEGKPRVVEYRESGSLSTLLSSALRPPAVDLTVDGVLGLDRSATLQYRYLPVP